MAVIVKKFGGTSVGSVGLIKNIADKIASGMQKGDSLVLVVSAMAKTTDELFTLAHAVSPHPNRREMDMLLTAGERISMSLMSFALQERGISSISFTGSQSGIITDSRHGNARILNVKAFRIKEELALGKVVIVAGFQGVSVAKEITTLGRGGSDTSAVALASYLKADLCEIFTDVEGVYTADPRLVKEPRRLSEVGYDAMLALSYNGSKVVHPRAVEFACKYNIPVEVKSSFTFLPGTMIRLEKDIQVEDRVLTAIAHKEDLIRYGLMKSEALQQMLTNWNYEIFKYYLEGERMDLLIESKYESEIDYELGSRGISPIHKETGLGYVTLVGLGINLDPAFLASVMDAVSAFEVCRISHSDRTIEMMLPSRWVVQCVQSLHEKYVEGGK